MTIQQLIFVYNADSDLFSSVVGFAHKIISPSTYNCTLCSLTYGNISIKQEWKNFIETLPIKTVFLHKDEFHKNYNQDAGLPAVFYKEGETVILFLGKEKIEQCQSVQNLIALILSELSKHDQHHYSNI
jgi:hypothetical protein